MIPPDSPQPDVVGARDRSNGCHAEDGDPNSPPQAQHQDMSAHRPPGSLANPEDVPDALPPGRVKLLAFFLVFTLWVGGWGAMDVLIEILAHDNSWVSFALYSSIGISGGLGIRYLAKSYRGYALLDEIQDMA
uniref:Uncharacterized protein n=1 Tax=Strombidinopsis acuminata TaxID=141414 RepID=A0A7S3U240_9SPIT|mmetsp:Transcript_84955/g.117288  ORF Transcript_84955/g.117288 Transcript_84955/m.117288 type:complete len:133 (+) Transcript_84955:2-400(+)